MAPAAPNSAILFKDVDPYGMLLIHSVEDSVALGSLSEMTRLWLLSLLLTQRPNRNNSVSIRLPRVLLCVSTVLHQVTVLRRKMTLPGMAALRR